MSEDTTDYWDAAEASEKAEMQLEKLQSINAELLSAANFVIETFAAIPATRKARLALALLLEVVVKAEKLK